MRHAFTFKDFSLSNSSNRFSLKPATFQSMSPLEFALRGSRDSGFSTLSILRMGSPMGVTVGLLVATNGDTKQATLIVISNPYYPLRFRRPFMLGERFYLASQTSVF